MFGVAIGDSIAQGYPTLWGRLLRDDDPTYDADYPNITGQFSAEFSRLFGFYWYNHGIAGETSAQVWARWRRDVLGEVYNPSDGRGSQTLPGKADFVFVHVGLNDFSEGSGLTPTDTQNNLTAMAQSCQSNNITAIFANVPFRKWNDLDQVAFNAAITPILQSYGAIVFDAHHFCKDVNNVDQRRFEYYDVDGVHPNKAGYIKLSQMVYETYINSI
jgi:lysophospholipase L1-like esterase